MEHSFVFTGGLIMTANKPFPELPEIQALKTRIAYMHLTADDNQMAALMRTERPPVQETYNGHPCVRFVSDFRKRTKKDSRRIDESPLLKSVPEGGLEPPLPLRELDFESSASANSATPAWLV